MHGFAVTTLFNEDERKFIARRSENKPLNEVIECESGSIWQVYERMLRRDKRSLWMLRKYREIKKNEEEKFKVSNLERRFTKTVMMTNKRMIEDVLE